MSNILALDVSGLPREWISYDAAILHHAKGQVAWSLGDTVIKYRGGTQKDGTKSCLETTSIIAINGSSKKNILEQKVMLTNSTLFARDCNRCSYCGYKFPSNKLSRDHIIPRFRGGEDTWMNTTSACMECNQYKGHKTLEEAGLELLFLPYVPTHAERLILQNRRILGDQMDYLIPMVPKHSRIFSLN